MSRLVIFEGCDGTGKTMLAKAFAVSFGARYVHLGPFPHVHNGLARLYAEAMLPAVLGLSDVVLDRCWVSERPYGKAFRDGKDRIGLRARLLERLAYRCETLVVHCMAPWEQVESVYHSRRALEMLESPHQLRQVHDWYSSQFRTALPHMEMCPLDRPVTETVERVFQGLRQLGSSPHPTDSVSAGNLRAPVLLVGEGFAEVRDGEPLVQWPFGALSGYDGSLWLAEQLESAGISERRLCWANANTIDRDIFRQAPHAIILGTGAARILHGRRGMMGVVSVEQADHPQLWRRFKAGQDYPLIAKLKEILS